MTNHPTLTVSALLDALAGRPDLADCNVLIDVSAWDEPLNLTGVISYADHPAIDDIHRGFIILTPSTEGATRLDPAGFPDSEAVADPLEAVDVAADTFAAEIEVVRAALRTLVKAAERGDIGELLHQAKTGDEDGFLIHHDALGQLLMEVLPIPEMDLKMPVAAKAYWAAVAEWMGPDWLESYRKVGAYMIKVEGF